MMDIEKLVEDLRGLLEQYGEKIPYGELVGAPWPYSKAGDLVWPDPEPYFIEQAATALSTLQVESEKLRAEVEQVKRERDAAVSDIETIMAYGGGTCQFCGNGHCYARGGEKPCLPKWRGRKAE